MKTKIVVLTDVHYASEVNKGCPERKGEFGDILLLRAVHRINRYLKPDIVLILGDLVDDACIENLKKIREILDLLTVPWLVLPGNHDCSPEEFSSVFPALPEYVDINNCRFIPFVDEERPEFNAWRSPQDIEKMATLASSWNGPVISVQHVPLFKPGDVNRCYNYTNADDIFQVIKRNGISHLISGHYHAGYQLLDQADYISVATPSLCDAPFRFHEIDISENGKTILQEHQLALPVEKLVDYHIHSNFAYCNENMDFEKASKLGEFFNLDKIAFAEHSGHLYYASQNYQAGICTAENLSRFSESRMPQYWQQANDRKSGNMMIGLEIDADIYGKPVILPEDREKAEISLGAMHFFPQDIQDNPETADVAFREIFSSFIQTPIDILAHPFRIFRRYNLKPGPQLYPFVVRKLKEHNIAAEINFHTNDPKVEFVQMCLEENVKLAFGSDSHNLYEVGEFYPHLSMLKKAGYSGDFDDILFRV